MASLATGNGVRVSDIAQQFSQGNIDFTDNNLDLAISGSGFFTVSDDGALAYTRAGAFKTNADGYVVNCAGAAPAGLSARSDGGGFNTGALSDLRLVTSGKCAQSPPPASKW